MIHRNLARWSLRVVATCALWLAILRWLHTAQSAVGILDKLVPESFWPAYHGVVAPLYGSDADPHDIDDDLIGLAMLVLSALCVALVEMTVKRFRRPQAVAPQRANH